MDVYQLLKLEPSSKPSAIIIACEDYYQRWTRQAVQKRLEQRMSFAEATVAAPPIWSEGQTYIKSLTAMLLDPSARECYDAWLETLNCPTPEKTLLMRSRLQWFNSSMHSSPIVFSEVMMNQLDNPTPPTPSTPSTPSTRSTLSKPSPPLKTTSLQPNCRVCQKTFDFTQPFLTFNCHCTTRVGHVACLEDFSSRYSEKCPVCRSKLLVRHQISKYLFWNVKDKYRFI
jgi:hypothetical protein